MEVIMVVAHDLAKVNGKVFLGPGTLQTCDRAILLAQQRKKCQLDPIIVVTAGYTKNWGVSLGNLMADYIYQKDPTFVVTHIKSPRFNTSGEMETLVRFAKSKVGLTKIAIVTKCWHGPRCCWLCRYWLIRLGLFWKIPMFVSPHGSNASWKAVANELFIVIPWNFIRGTILTPLDYLHWLFTLKEDES